MRKELLFRHRLDFLIGGFLLVRRLGLFGGARPDPQWGVRGIMGPAIMLTLGVQFLLDSLGIIRFGRTLPALLVVIGLVKILHSTTNVGHGGGPPTPTSGTPPSGLMAGEVQSPPAEVKNG